MKGVSARGLVLALALVALVVVLPRAGVSEEGGSGGTVRVTGLKTEYARNPVGIDTERPRFGWRLESGRRGVAQSAYRLLVSSDRSKLAAGVGDVWDSGKVASSRSVNVAYGGGELESGVRYYWKVRVWDEEGGVSGWSRPAFFEMGLLDPSDWRARWIGLESRAATPINNAQQNYPARLEPGSTLGQSFAVDGEFTAVSGRFPTWQTTGSGLTLALRRDGPEGEILARRRFSDVVDNSWLQLELSEPLPAGTYYLEASEPEGTIGWWSHDQDVYPGGQAFAGGEPAGGDRTLRVDVPVPPPPMLRKEFSVSGRVRRARLYASALGLYELRLNGRKVGDHLFAPGWTDYGKRIQYQTYDVTGLLRRGTNALGALLGDGWYAGHVAMYGRNLYGNNVFLLAQLVIDYADGSSETVASDVSWRGTREGPLRSSDILMGEIYDARLERPGWDRPGFDDSGWETVIAKDDVAGRLVAQADPPVRVTGELKPVALTEPEEGTYVFDMGQNMVGSVRLRVSGREGERVRLRHAEVLNPDGTIYTQNLRTARATDEYVLRGGGEEVYEPRFTFHGFRYVEVTGYPGRRPSLDAVVGRVIGTAAPISGTFETSDRMVNRLQSNITWSQRGNFLSIPTDCPQRDERMGWTGDINVFAPTAAFNMEVARFLGTKWLRDLRDAQRPDGAFTDVAPYVPIVGAGVAGWGDAGVTVPWTVWRRYGDTRVIEENYEAMVRWLAYLEEHSTGYLRPAEGYGDWLNVGDETPKDVVATAYFAHSARLVSEMAAAVGREGDARRYRELFESVREAFNEAYVSSDGRIRGDTQTAYVLALHMELLPEEKRAAAARRLVEHIEARGWHLSTGFLGTPHLLPVLTEAGRTDVAYRLLNQRTFPSWLYEVERGATTTWERWDSIKPDGSFNDPAMNSFNHYAYGAVGDWLYRYVAGISPEEPGYRRILIRPRPGGGLDRARGELESPYGRILSEWRLRGGKLRMRVSIPPNTRAGVCVPARDAREVRVSPPVPGANPSQRDGCAVFELGSGTYEFRSRLPG